MATPVTGRVASFVIASTGVVENIGRWEINFTADSLDASVFGSVWGKTLPGMIKWSGSAEGFFDVSTSGIQQLQLQNAAMDQTKIQDARFYLTGTSGLFYMPNYSTVGIAGDTDAGIFIGNFRVSADKAAITGISFDILGYGPIALFKGGSSMLIIEGT